MMRDVLLFSRIATARMVNGFLYFLQRLPLVGKLISDRCYQLDGLKKGLGIFIWILKILYLLSKSGLYVGSCILLPLVLINAQADIVYLRDNLLFGFIIFTGVLGATQNGKMLSPTGDLYTMTRLMHMPSRRFILHNAFYFYGMNVIGIMSGFLAFSLYLDIPYWYALVAGCLYIGSHIGFEALHLQLFKKYKSLVLNHNAIRYPLYILCLLAVYVSYAVQVHFTFAPTLFLVYGALCIPLSFYAVHVFKTSHEYPDVLNALLLEYGKILAISQDKQAMAKTGISVEEKDYNVKELNTKQSHLHGYQFLNHLFFKRHKRLIQRPIKRRLLFILALTILCVAVRFFIDLSISDTSLLELLPPMIFFMYMLNISEKVCRAMFMNCDVSLLHYGYYRQPKAILENFRIRMKALCSYNMLITSVLCVCLICCLSYLGIRFTWLELLLFVLALFSLTIFFSTHYLFTYYIFQPYNEEFSMKNPFFSIINGAVYVVCYYCIRLSGNFTFVCGVLAATITYVLIALILIYRLAPKTFHLK